MSTFDLICVNTIFSVFNISCSDYGDNITIPILLTILASDRPNDELRQSVENSLEELNLGLGNFQEIGRYSEHRIYLHLCFLVTTFVNLSLQTIVHRKSRYFLLQTVIPI